jgi:hypothetical protein
MVPLPNVKCVCQIPPDTLSQPRALVKTFGDERTRLHGWAPFDTPASFAQRRFQHSLLWVSLLSLLVGVAFVPPTAQKDDPGLTEIVGGAE